MEVLYDSEVICFDDRRRSCQRIFGNAIRLLSHRLSYECVLFAQPGNINKERVYRVVGRRVCSTKIGSRLGKCFIVDPAPTSDV